MSVGYTKSDESDYTAETWSMGIAQDMFGDLTTVSMGFAYGDNTVEQNGNPDFEEGTEVRSYRIGLSQIFTKSLIMAFTFETISDEGYSIIPTGRCAMSIIAAQLVTVSSKRFIHGLVPVMRLPYAAITFCPSAVR